MGIDEYLLKMSIQIGTLAFRSGR